MKSIKLHTRVLSALAISLLAGAFVAGCSGDDGKDGDPGPAGTAGTAGTPGINCWDLNQNGVADLATEDTNKDGKVDTNDCRTPSGAYDAVSLHKGYFTENAYTGATQCLNCHGKIGDDVMTTAHWKWEGTVWHKRVRGHDPRQEGPDQQLLPGGAVERGPLRAVPYRHRLERQDLQLRQPEEHRLPRLPRPDRYLQEGCDSDGNHPAPADPT